MNGHPIRTTHILAHERFLIKVALFVFIYGIPMTDENKPDKNTNISDNAGDIDVGNVVGGDVHGDVVGGDKVAGDKVVGDKITHEHQHTTFDQRGQQVGTQYNVAGNLVVSEKPPAEPPDPTVLAAAEEQYRARLKERYAEDAPYYVPMSGETTEVTSASAETKAPRSARRRRQRAMAEYHEWIQVRQEIKRVKLDSLAEGVDKYPCIILLGDPGSGKTTALENLAYTYAAELKWLPLPLRLSEFGPGMTVEELIRQGWGGSLGASHWGAPELEANLDNYLEAGQLFILFDALNEMPHEGYKERASALRHFIEAWQPKGNRFLVTCRVLDYGEELSGLQRIEIQPLSDDQIQTFLQNELEENWQALWEELNPGGDDQRRLLDMAHNPYLLTMMIDIYAEDGQLGQNRAELLDRFTQIQMEWARQKSPSGQWLEREVQRESLATLAYEMQKRAGSGARVETAKVKVVMPQQVQPDPAWPPIPSPPDQVLTLAASANLIEMPVDRSSVRFYHQLLQEYFAARELLKQVERGPKDFENPSELGQLWKWPWLEAEMPLWVRPEGTLDPLPGPPQTGWEETTILAAGLAAENDEQLVKALIQVNPVLAGRCVHEGRAKVGATTRQDVIEALLETIARPEVALRVRMAAGEVLGHLGDPRLGELVTIPAGKFIMGERGERHKIDLPEYQIGKYPVTYAEYAPFIEAGSYQDERWWTAAGWKWKQRKNQTEPDYWYDTRYSGPNLPVVGVRWYEAVAYCRWLAEVTGQPYRLQTEAEWEKAARGTDGHEYPWGNQFEVDRLNAAEGDQWVGTTTPVGIYPTGASPYGCLDMAGNIWEWTTTLWGKGFVFSDYKYPYNPDDGRENLKAGDNVLRMVRGGSFDQDPYYARCAARFWNNPDFKRDSQGFRVIVSPSSPPSALWHSGGD